MKIAYVFDPRNLHSTTYSGVVRQGLAWAEGLTKLGIQVEFPAPHTSFDWAHCELLHLFQYGDWAEGLLEAAARNDIPAVLSPIVDRPTPYGWRGRIISRIPFEAFGLRQRHRTLCNLMARCQRVLARSELEKSSLEDISVSPWNIEVVRLGVEIPAGLESVKNAKAAHVFHMSHLNQERKNVRSLIKACEELGIRLRLAGKISDKGFAAWLNAKCEEQPLLEYLGTLSETRKWYEMSRAAVFCLPSLNEGIGLVALEAYVAGAHVVITNRTGGVEYFDGDVEVCDPTSINQIAECIDNAMKKPRRNCARLGAFNAFSSEASVAQLVEVYRKTITEFGLLQPNGHV